MSNTQNQDKSHASVWRVSLPEVLVGVVSFGLVIGVAFGMAEHDPDPIRWRTIRTIHATIVLITIAICLYFLWNRGGVFKRLWRAFWLFAYGAFLVHLYCAVFGTFGGNIAQVFQDKAKVSHPIYDTLMAVWWGIDVVLAWTRNPESPGVVRIERGIAHVWFPVAFFLATREAKVGPEGRLLGLIMLTVVSIAIVIWACVRPPLRK